MSAALIGAICGALIVSLLSGDTISESEQRAIIDRSVSAAMEDATERMQQQLRGDLIAQRGRVAEIFAQTSESIVVIDAEGPERLNDEGVTIVPAALATGFALDDDGHIVTAAHVLEGMTSFSVILPDGTRRAAEIIGDDRPFSDVAVLQLLGSDGDGTPLSAPTFGETASVEAGEPVLAIGNTLLGRDLAVTVGVVSDPDTTFFRERYEQEQLIQTDAALNHGNSGGVLVDLDGNIIGMTAVIARSTHDGGFVDGVGFAIQIDAVLEVAQGIAADGFFPRPTFGVVDERLLTPTAAQQLELDVSEGSFLIELSRNGAFARAGIRPGDVVRSLDGQLINADMPYLNALAELEPNVPVIVHVHRDGEEYRLSIAPEMRLP